MIKFLTLTLRNFLSYGNNTTVINLDKPGTTLIVGENLDDSSNGIITNGTGKTVIINALTYALYDKPVSDITKDKLVNNINKKNLEVTLTFERNGVYYMVKRVRKSKSYAAGNYVKLFERKGSPDFTKEDEITRDNKNTNKLIESIIGIPHELFVRIVVFSATKDAFLKLPVRHPTAPSQTSFIEELFELTGLAQDAEALKQKIKDTDRQLTLIQTKNDALEKEHNRHAEQIKSAKQRCISWEYQNSEAVAALKTELESMSQIDLGLERDLHDRIADLSNLCSTVSQQLRDMQNERKAADKKVQLLTQKMSSTESELEHLQDDKCPYCLQQYADANVKIAECEKNIFDLGTELESLLEEISKRKESIKDKKAELAEHEVEMKQLQQQLTIHNIDDLYNARSKIDQITQQIQSLENAENPFIEPLDELETMELEELNYDEFNKLKKLLDHQKFLLKLLTKKDSFVRKSLINKNIPFLNSRLQQYLTILGLPYNVEFTHELTAEISHFGTPMDFGNLSNGQSARLNVALSFAFRDVLQKLHNKVSICMVDEVLDFGLDSVGIMSAAKLLKHKAREEDISLYIISHRDEIDSAFDRTMTVQMIKRFSYIKES